MRLRKITIPEGYEIKQIAQKLDEAGIVSWQDFYAALNPDDYDYAFLKNLPERDGRMEGICSLQHMKFERNVGTRYC